MNNPTLISIGPRGGRTSWDFFGIALGNELKQWYRVKHFDKFGNFTRKAQVNICLKNTSVLGKCYHYVPKSKYIYLPIDRHKMRSRLESDLTYVRPDVTIICNSIGLYKHMRSLIIENKVYYIPHHILYYNIEPVQYKKKGFILYIGTANQNLEAFLNWTGKKKLPYPVKILTKPKRHRAGGLDQYPFAFYEWTPENHIKFLKEAKAVIDIKGASFGQQVKPATKALEIVASGGALAINKSNSRQLFIKELGFELANPLDFDYWFSKEYFDKIQAIRQKVIYKYSVQKVAPLYRNIINATFND